MAIKTKKPSRKQTVGAQYLCFASAEEAGGYDGTYEADVEKTEVVKNVKITENSETSDAYASGKVYDSDTPMASIDVEVEVLAFPDDTISRMRGDTVEKSGLILSGANSERPFFAYGKVVKLKNGNSRYEWYPKCKLTENSDDVATSEEKASEQTDTIKIRAYPFDIAGNIFTKVTESTAPEGLTEEKFFAKPILTDADLTAALS